MSVWWMESSDDQKVSIYGPLPRLWPRYKGGGGGLLRYLIIVNEGCHLVDNMVFKPSHMQF